MPQSLEGFETAGAFCQGKTLVVGRNITLPPICVKCGQPTARDPIKKTFQWHNPWLFLMILFPGLLFYLIVALIVRKKFELAVPVCEEHKLRRRRLLWTAAVLLLGGIPFGILLDSLGATSGWVALLVISVILAGMVFWAVGLNLLSPTYIGENYATFKGAGNDFLTQLPPLARKSAAAG